MSAAAAPMDGWALTKITASCFVFGTLVFGLLVYSIRDKWVPVGDAYVLVYPSTGSNGDYNLKIRHPQLIGPKPSNVCDHISVPDNFTLVTGLHDSWGGWTVPDFEQSREQYLRHVANVLHLHVNLVVYIDKDLQDFVRYHRKGKLNSTRIIIKPQHKLEYYKYYDRVRGIMESYKFQHELPVAQHPERLSPDYDVITNSKVGLLQEASEENPFGSDYMFWIDAAYGRSDSIFPGSCRWQPENAMRGNKISIIGPSSDLANLHRIEDLYKLKHRQLFTGFFGGSRSAVRGLHELHSRIFVEEFLDKNRVDGDAMVLTACYLKEHQLFNLAVGGYEHAFELFN